MKHAVHISATGAQHNNHFPHLPKMKFTNPPNYLQKWLKVEDTEKTIPSLSRPHKTESCLGNMTRVQAGLPQGNLFQVLISPCLLLYFYFFLFPQRILELTLKKKKERNSQSFHRVFLADTMVPRVALWISALSCEMLRALRQ